MAGSVDRSCPSELAYRLLVSLPRSRLATIQRRIAPLLQFDLIGVGILSLHCFAIESPLTSTVVSSYGSCTSDILLSTFSNVAHMWTGEPPVAGPRK